MKPTTVAVLMAAAWAVASDPDARAVALGAVGTLATVIEKAGKSHGK